MDDPAFEPLRRRLAEIADLQGAAAVLGWDQYVYLPSGGGGGRGRQLGTLARLTHERWTDPGLLRDLVRAERAEAAVPSADGAALVRVVRRHAERELRVPPAFVTEMALATSATFDAWVEARARDDGGVVLERLERTLDLSLRYAALFPEHAHPVDALIDPSDEGSTVATLTPLFQRLRDAVVPWVATWASAEPAAGLPSGPYDRDAQLAAGLEFAAAIGYDLRRGRQDDAPHPFAVRVAQGDVRITTRTRPDDLTEGLFSTLHEAGHAIYDQGIDAAYEGTPLAEGVSAGVHESQARLWENQVGRSRAFWAYALPRLRRRFPVLASVDPDRAYRAVNRVVPSLIRTEADEVTYNLHVIVRFDLEVDLFAGRLQLRDLPEAWAERYATDLGVRPQGHQDGWLQDVHWFGGLVGGGFQGYTLGNVLSAQLHAAAARDLGDLDAMVEAGEFAPLQGWLRDRVHRHGSAKPVDRLVHDATGSALDAGPYLAYLRSKYEPLLGTVQPAG